MKQFVKDYLKRNWPQLVAMLAIGAVLGLPVFLLCLLWGWLECIGIERTMKLNFEHDLAELRKLATEAQPQSLPSPKQRAAAWAKPTPDTEAAVLRRPDGDSAIIQGIDQEIVGANRCRYIERERDRVRLQLLLLNQELEALLAAARAREGGAA